MGLGLRYSARMAFWGVSRYLWLFLAIRGYSWPFVDTNGVFRPTF
jgi:hypothetical protein